MAAPPNAPPAQPISAATDHAETVNSVESVVRLHFASWNRVAGWLRRLAALQRAAYWK